MADVKRARNFMENSLRRTRRYFPGAGCGKETWLRGDLDLDPLCVVVEDGLGESSPPFKGGV